MPKITLRSPITFLITMEGLATSPLGCYGCSWNKTPAIDAVTSEGVVWDRWTSPIDQPNGLITNWLEGARDVIGTFGKRGNTVFLTDDRQHAVPDDAFGFGASIRLEPGRHDTPVDSIEETALANSFETMIDQVDAKTSLVWLHSSFLRDQWDAPLVDEFDVDEASEPQEEDVHGRDTVSIEPFRLPATATPPGFQLSEQDDPDLLFAWIERYAAQVRLLDQMVGLLSDTMRNRKPTILLAGASGFSLGENGWVGHRVGPLRSQDIRLPMVASLGGPLRVPSLRSAVGLPEVLERLAMRRPLIEPAEWCDTDDAFQPSIQTHSDRARKAVTTSTWFYVNDQDDQSPGNERLFLKPDDVSDVNDISRLRREVVDQLANESRSS